METASRNELIDLAFGKQAWAQYFGDVDEEPPLPGRIINILDSPCPFYRTKKVKNTHLLVLIPATINGDRFTLNKLGELVKRQFPNNEDGYRYFHPSIRNTFGNEPLPEVPYWLLMTREVLIGSRNKNYSDQQAMASCYSNHGYRLPYGLEVATCILAHYARSGDCLFANYTWTHTRCIATQLVDNGWPLIVGGFSQLGLHIFLFRINDVDSYYSYSCGVACCRRL